MDSTDVQAHGLMSAVDHTQDRNCKSHVERASVRTSRLIGHLSCIVQANALFIHHCDVQARKASPTWCSCEWMST